MMVGGGEARLVHAIPRVALVILGVAAFHRVEVLDEVIPGGLHQIAGQQGDDHPLARHGAPTALVSRRSRRLPSGLRSDHWPIVIGDFIELFGDAHSEDFPDLQELERISTWSPTPPQRQTRPAGSQPPAKAPQLRAGQTAAYGPRKCCAAAAEGLSRDRVRDGFRSSQSSCASSPPRHSGRHAHRLPAPQADRLPAKAA
jgi:hypothetical protein